MKAVTREINKRVKVDASDLELQERLMTIDRVIKVVKGGRRLRFRALLVIGDGQGHVGLGLAKATGVPEAIRKAGAVARKELVEVPVVGGTVPHSVFAKFGASKVLLKPARPGGGMIASHTVRAVLELAGITDITCKSLGSSNPVNVARATMLALTSLRKPGKAFVKDESDFTVEKEEESEAE